MVTNNLDKDKPFTNQSFNIIKRAALREELHVPLWLNSLFSITILASYSATCFSALFRATRKSDLT